MPTKDEFFTALHQLQEAARHAHQQMPPEMGGRDRRLWEGLLTRLPEQIDDLKANLAGPERSGNRSSGIIV
jgi:hypothetical protein